MSYATIADLREYLDQVEAGAAVDAFLQRVLDRAEEVVDGYLTFSFAAYGEASAKDVRAQGGEYLEVPGHEQGSVASVYLVRNKDASYESTSEVTDYGEMEDGRLYRDIGWAPGRWYRVTAEWGYGAAPADVVEVELRVGVNIWQGRAAMQWSNSLGVEGSGSVTYSRALTGAEKSMLDAVRYRVLGGPTFA
jgi:hypothetical protein